MEGEAESKSGGSHEEAKPPPARKMNRRQWRAARGNREDKWTRKQRLSREANEKKFLDYEEEVMAAAAAQAADLDPEAAIAVRYRDSWIAIFSHSCGSYEDTTSIPPMRYTDAPAPFGSGCEDAVIIFSVKVTELLEDLQWPLDVYGIVAARDSLDRRRNLLFSRSRDNCQTLTAEDASLLLTGPTRAVVIMDDVHFEVELRVKGETPSEDKLLSLLLIDDTYTPPGARCHGVYYHVFSSKLSTVEVTVGHLERTVEATIAVQVVEGSWPTQYHGRFVACIASLDDRDMVLLDSRVGTVPVVSDHGTIQLSRCVVSVEVDGELPLLLDAWQGDDNADAVAKDRSTFTPLRAGRSKGMWDVGFCKMEVTVAWSLVMS